MDEETGAFNYTGLEWNMKERAGMFYGMQMIGLIFNSKIADILFSSSRLSC